MRVEDAKAVAGRWVRENAAQVTGFRGAFLHGSVNWLDEDAILAPSSDLDVMVVIDQTKPLAKPGKFIEHGVLLEVSYLPNERVQSQDRILGDYQLASSFRTASVIADLNGALTNLQIRVEADFARRRWVRARCEHARANVLNHLHSLDASAPFHDQVTSWLFGTGVTTHVLLVAGLKNPTVRKRYLAARELLEAYDLVEFQESLLDLLGCAEMNRARVEHHLASLAEVFDAAKVVIRTPFFFASDISDAARPIAIDGSRVLIARGFHREAVFWIVATFARCMKVLHHDGGPALTARFEPGFLRLLGDLGIGSTSDLLARSERVNASLPRVWAVAEAIMAANQEIKG